MRKSFIFLTTALVAMIALALTAADMGSRNVVLNSVDNSGITASAKIEAQGGGQTQVEVSINQGEKNYAYAAAMNFGVCEDIGGVAFKLKALQAGRSHTVLPIKSIDRPFAITLSKGAEVVACGTLDQVGASNQGANLSTMNPPAAPGRPPSSAPIRKGANTMTFRGAGVTLHSPLAFPNIHDYVLVVAGGSGGSEKRSFRISDSTKIVDPRGKTVDMEKALNESVEVTYENGKSEPYRAIQIECLEL